MEQDKQAEILELQARLQKKTETSRYLSHQGNWYESPSTSGYTVLPVLPFLTGLPMNDLVMAYVRSLRPSSVRITTGMQTTDSRCWRVTIVIDDQDRVQSITQEVEVSYGCGADVGACLRAAMEQAQQDLLASKHTGPVEAKAPPRVIGNLAVLARAKF